VATSTTQIAVATSTTQIAVATSTTQFVQQHQQHKLL